MNKRFTTDVPSLDDPRMFTINTRDKIIKNHSKTKIRSKIK